MDPTEKKEVIHEGIGKHNRKKPAADDLNKTGSMRRQTSSYVPPYELESWLKVRRIDINTQSAANQIKLIIQRFAKSAPAQD